MTNQELEIWTLDIISALIKDQPIEDSRIGLKSEWPEPSKAAHHLAAHANAARGTPILWLVGIDEKAKRILGAHRLFDPRYINPLMLRIVSMKRANNLVAAVLSIPSQHPQPKQFDEAWKAVRGCGEQ